LTLSTQVTLDYHSESDFSNKVRVQLAASPVVAALFANSPIEAGRYSGALSRRTQYYFKLDPNRCGYPTFALKNEITFDDVIDCLLQLPMVYRYKNGRYEAPPKRPFAELIDQGFGDGTTPSLLDWTSQLSQVWPYVRVRNTVELRVADGPTYPNIPALPAFWVGLTYHHPSCEAAWDVLQGHTFAEHHQAMYDVTVNGLSARLGNDPIQELAIELVRLAKQGLSARIEAGLESPRALAYLDPIDEVAMSGTTFAQTCLQRWENELHYQPARYVDAYRL
jgi:glutamate--cysteine ligase